MHTFGESVRALAGKPSGFVPLVMSGLALALLLGFLGYALATGGIVRSEDEGVGARLYQLLIFGQVFVIGWFVLRWGPRDPLAALAVLALQALAIAASFGPLWWFGL